MATGACETRWNLRNLIWILLYSQPKTPVYKLAMHCFLFLFSPHIVCVCSRLFDAFLPQASNTGAHRTKENLFKLV